MTQEINPKNATDVKLLLQIEKYRQQIVRIQRALDRTNKGGQSNSLIDYARGEQRSLERVIRDFEELLR